MRKIYLCLIAATTILSANAEPVTPERARRVAENHFLTETGRKPTLVDRTAHLGLTELYLFEPTNGKGYVVIAGDDVAWPVLAWSPDNTFSCATMSPAVKDMLDWYEEQIRTVKVTADAADKAVADEWAALETADGKRAAAGGSGKTVDQLITTQWNQDMPYNNACPQADGQDRSVTGCVATAMAQVMRYWKYPEHGTGQHSYTYDDRPIAVINMLGDSTAVWMYDTLTVDYENTYYDWDNMPNVVTASSSDAEKEAVSTLIYHCGVAVDMVYTPEGSGAFMTRAEVIGFDTVNFSTEIAAEVVIPQYFGYSPDLAGLMHSDYTTREWTVMLKSELDYGHPIIFAGNAPESDYGHAFVLDGYNARSFFHCNFGWGGLYDGWFRVDNIIPAPRYDFTAKQSAIFHMYPSGLMSVAVKCSGNKGSVYHGETPLCNSFVHLTSGSSDNILSIVADPGYAVQTIAIGSDTVYTAGTVAEEWTDIITGTQGHDTILCDLSSMDGDVAIEVVFAAEPFSVEIHCESQQGGQGSVYHNDTSVCNDIITITTGHDDETLLIVAGEGSHTAAIRIGDRTVFENTVIAEGAPLSPQTAGRYDTIVCSLASLTADTTITAVFAPGNNDLSVGEATPYPNAAKQISVYAADGSIILKGDHIGKGCVYDEMGRCVARFDGGSQVVTIPVGKRGLYVVQTANHSYKVGLNL